MLGMTEGRSSASNRFTWSLNGYTWSTGKTGIAYLISWLVTLVSSANSSLSSINSNTTYLSSLYSLIGKQWGQGFGGTIVEYKNSPLYYLRWIYDSQWTAWGHNYDGTAVYFGNSPAGWLHTLASSSQWTGSLGSLGQGTYGSARLLAFLASAQLTGNVSLADIRANTQWTGSLGSLGQGTHSVARLLAFISSAQLTANASLSDIWANTRWTGSVGSLGQGTHSSARLLALIASYLANLRVSVGDVSLDASGVESRLDSIIRLLTVAGVVENAKDVLDAIFGDMSLDATGAASAAVGSAIQNAFPFCVPAVLKQILGLLQADPAPPEFHFDFWGAPLDFGFSDWQGLADMTSWLSRIGFAVVLFANSRRFVYSGGVAGD